MCEAYEILSDPKTKQIYDAHGASAIVNGISEGPNTCDAYIKSGQPYKVFEAFFGSANPFVCDQHPEDRALDLVQQINEKEHQNDIEVTVECELNEFYCGALKEIQYQKIKRLAVADKTDLRTQTMTIEVKPGYGEHTCLRYPGKGHEAFASKPSDLVIKFKQVPKANY